MKHTIPNIIFEITKMCNLNCMHCYNHWRGMDDKGSNPSFQSISKTLKTICRKINFNHIVFTGGEPFLAEGIAEHALYCRMKKKAVSIISNGTAAELKDYTTLHQLGISNFQFSLLGPDPDIHDQLTQRKGSFAKIVRTIKHLKNLGGHVIVIFVITKTNAPFMIDTFDLAFDLGISDIMIARFNIGGNGISNSEKLLLSLTELQYSFHLANEFAAVRPVKITSNVCVPFCAIDPSDYPHIPISSCSQDIERRPITIDVAGDVRICNHSPVVMGNIYTSSISDIFKSEYAQSWQNLKPEFCDGCRKWNRCLGGCRAASEQMGKTVAHEDPIIELMGLKTYDLNTAC